MSTLYASLPLLFLCLITQSLLLSIHVHQAAAAILGAHQESSIFPAGLETFVLFKNKSLNLSRSSWCP